MPRRLFLFVCACWIGVASSTAQAAPPGDDRSTLPRGINPYVPDERFGRLTTPGWVGEPGVEAVVVLAIDDMRDPARYEQFLRPILDRLKKIDGRAPVSIMTNQVDPKDPRLQGWLREGLSIEVHTLTHPCPCLQKGDFAEAARTYHDCVDLMNAIPGNRPVAFRMPCCDSINSVSPRFFAEIFNRTSPRGHSLAIDSSVFTLLTPDDPGLPRELVFDPDGRERFRKYLPFPAFVNTIDNYPYPYIIGGKCWEFPCIVPSDWEGQNINRPNSPRTLADMKAALDAVVIKQGVFDLVFHPHGWIRSDQVVDLIDHAVKTHGKKVKFLTFREALERLERNVLGGKPLRPASDSENHRGGGVFDINPSLPLPPATRALVQSGRDGGVRFVDIDEDGHDDLVFSNDQDYGVHLFDPATRGWTRRVMAGKADEPGALPRIVRDGDHDNGFFVHSRSLWWQNEDTAKLPNLVDRRSFNELLRDVEPTGKSPEASLRSIRVAPGFRVELAAAEPLVKDPIAFDWGADGRLWVVEMGDYPLGTDGRGKPGGVVRVLVDEDGDGRYDRASTFLDGLGFPTGILPWKNGVLVACAPEIFLAEDRDGDGRADHREVLFTGFREGNQQHRLNGFELGLDGWVYGANGDSGGEVRSLKTGKTVSISGRDFRFRPDTGEFEAESGQTQYGRHRDDWGHWFGNNNPNWAWQYVLSEHDVRRNPHHAAPDPRQMLEPETRLFPISRTLARFNDPGAANHVTSANSATPYRDELFGPWFASSLFVSEPVHNVVHRIVLEPEGATFRGRRGPNESGREFLASSDNWFRPTMLRTGPDGALWIADMYRAVIEHPEWIPDDWERRLDLRAGSEQGRIYRVYPVDRKPRAISRLDRLDAAGLAAALDSPNGWQRDTAQRLLLHRGGTEAVAALRTLAAGTARPQTRVQAIWTLADLGALDEPSALAGLTDTDPRVREAVVAAVEPLLPRSPAVAAAVLRLAEDPAAPVRFRVALLLGNWTDRRAGEALARLARRDGGNSWMRAAILSSAMPHVPVLLAGLLDGEGEEKPSPIVEPVLELAGAMPGGISDAAVRSIGRPAGPGGRYAPWQYTALAGLLSARERSKTTASLDLERLFDEVWESARRVVGDVDADEPSRLAAVGLLRHSAARESADRDRLVLLLSPRTPMALQLAAVDALGRLRDPAVARLMIEGWRGRTPQLHSAILDAILGRPAWRNALLSALEAGRIPPSEVDTARRQRLLRDRDPALRARATALFARESKERRAVIDAFQPALRTTGDPTAGAAVFRKLCITCHRLGGEGVQVGPDLATLNDKSPGSLLSAIFDPNRALESKYAAYTVATVDGRVLTGIITSETATSVTLRRQEGKDEVLLRSEIEQIAASGQSLMPEGLEKDLTPRDLADLIAYIRAAAPERRNQPQSRSQ